MVTSNEAEKKLRKALIGPVITKVDLFIVNDQAFDFANRDRQLVDGGIQISFNDGTQFTYGWDSNFELQNIAYSNFTSLYTGSNYKQFSTTDDAFWKDISGHKITDIKTEWCSFEEPDGNIHYSPLYVLLTLDNANKFLLSAMEFELIDKKIENLTFNIEGWIFIHFDEQDIAKIMSLPLAE